MKIRRQWTNPGSRSLLAAQNTCTLELALRERMQNCKHLHTYNTCIYLVNNYIIRVSSLFSLSDKSANEL